MKNEEENEKKKSDQQTKINQESYKIFLIKCIFNQNVLINNFASFLNFIDFNKFKYTTKYIYTFLNNNLFIKNYYLKILKYPDFKNSKNIDYHFDAFKKIVFDPRIKIINKLTKHSSYYWYADNRICMKCGRKSYPNKLKRYRLNKLLRTHSPICFCKYTVTNTIMANEETKLETEIKNLNKKKIEIEKKIQKKKEELKNHKNTKNLTNFKNYLNQKVNTLKHGRQKNQCKNIINFMDHENIRRLNPQYSWIIQA